MVLPKSKCKVLYKQNVETNKKKILQWIKIAVVKLLETINSKTQ